MLQMLHTKLHTKSIIFLGDFKFIGEWLAKAEKLIYCDTIPTIMNEETAMIISRKLEEHKSFFADLPTIQKTFVAACQSPLAREVPSEQLENMTVRLNEIGPKAAQRRVRLKFLEHKVIILLSTSYTAPYNYIFYISVLPYCIFATYRNQIESMDFQIWPRGRSYPIA